MIAVVQQDWGRMHGPPWVSASVAAAAQGTGRKVGQESLQTGTIRSHPHNVTQQFSTWKQPWR